MNIYKSSQEMTEQVIANLDTCKDLLGSKNEDNSQYSFIPGLNLLSDEKEFTEYIETLRAGIFQVLFTGGFSSGKSTLLNALMHKNLLNTGINPETAVITKLVFNAEEKAIVYKKQIDNNGCSVTETLSVPAFFEKYRVSQENAFLFADIDHVVLRQPQDGIGGNMVQLVDSPGTQNSQADTEAARRFAKKASAIVYLISALQPFTDDDKEYIRKHFAGQNMKNLFFVINRFDNVAQDQVEPLKANVRNQLSKVFTDVNGKFDEELFNSRVFYTNAYGSLCARTGQKFMVMNMPIDIDDNITGVPQFEQALGEFLTDDNRDKEALRAYLPKVASAYVRAENQVKENIMLFEQGIDKLRRDKEQMDDCILRANQIITGIEQTCRQASQNILMNAKSEYDSFVNNVEADWEQHFNSISYSGFNWATMIQIAWGNIMNKENGKKQAEEKMKPIIDALRNYCTEKMKVMQDNMASLIEAQVVELENQLANYYKQLSEMNCPIDIAEIMKNISMRNGMMPDQVGGLNTNIFQVIVGIIGSDPDLIMDGIGGMKGNKEFLTKFLTRNIFEFIATYVVAWPLGIAALVVRLVSAIKNVGRAGNATAVQILEKMKPETIQSFRESKAAFMADIEQHMGAVFVKASKTFTADLRDELDGHLKTLEETIDSIGSAEFNAEDERKRTKYLLDEFVRCFNNISRLVSDRELTREEIKKLAENPMSESNELMLV